MMHDPQLDRLIGYQIQRAELAMTDDARRILDPYGLTPAKLTALLMVRANPGCDQTALGRALSINRSSTMKLVNSLVARHLIERRPGRDLRTNALYLLSEAEVRMDGILNDLRASDDRMTARLTDNERTTLRALLRKLGPASQRRSQEAAVEPGRVIDDSLRRAIEWDCMRLINLYATLNDEARWEDVADLFTDDGVMIRPAATDDPIVGRSAILAAFKARPPRVTQHVCGNVVVAVEEPDSAKGSSAMLLFTDKTVPPLVGGFTDHFRHVPGQGWRFAERRGWLRFD